MILQNSPLVSSCPNVVLHHVLLLWEVAIKLQRDIKKTNLKKLPEVLSWHFDIITSLVIVRYVQLPEHTQVKFIKRDALFCLQIRSNWYCCCCRRQLCDNEKADWLSADRFCFDRWTPCAYWNRQRRLLILHCIRNMLISRADHTVPGFAFTKTLWWTNLMVYGTE